MVSRAGEVQGPESMLLCHFYSQASSPDYGFLYTWECFRPSGPLFLQFLGLLKADFLHLLRWLWFSSFSLELQVLNSLSVPLPEDDFKFLLFFS